MGHFSNVCYKSFSRQPLFQLLYSIVTNKLMQILCCYTDIDDYSNASKCSDSTQLMTKINEKKYENISYITRHW